jgi:hypothetical protein
MHSRSLELSLTTHLHAYIYLSSYQSKTNMGERSRSIRLKVGKYSAEGIQWKDLNRLRMKQTN